MTIWIFPFKHSAPIVTLDASGVCCDVQTRANENSVPKRPFAVNLKSPSLPPSACCAGGGDNVRRSACRRAGLRSLFFSAAAFFAGVRLPAPPSRTSGPLGQLRIDAGLRKIVFERETYLARRLRTDALRLFSSTHLCLRRSHSVNEAIVKPPENVTEKVPLFPWRGLGCHES